MTTGMSDPNGFDESGFWGTLTACAKRAGQKVVLSALKAFYVLRSSETPLWAKSVVAGALVYFVSPVDAVPDVLPVAGYSDDLAVLLGALKSVADHVTPPVTRQAEETLRRWFG